VCWLRAALFVRSVELLDAGRFATPSLVGPASPALSSLNSPLPAWRGLDGEYGRGPAESDGG